MIAARHRPHLAVEARSKCRLVRIRHSDDLERRRHSCRPMDRAPDLTHAAAPEPLVHVKGTD
jgi:hypothetical protein